MDELTAQAWQKWKPMKSLVVAGMTYKQNVLCVCQTFSLLHTSRLTNSRAAPT